ncbi:AAA family ATPase [Nocardia sp. N2S4-5]|uniref:AAA family ATPase n=1 Tax=Nocardia sp. N2S4-5 TaxID=3351565 RepID=UPI0037D253F8
MARLEDMMVKGTDPVLRGRERERALLANLLRCTMIGHGGAALIHGDPGIGKSALLNDAVHRVNGMRVLRVTCVEPESDLGYAMLHRLVTPALDRIDRLAAPQAGALRTIFGLAAGATPDRFLVGVATLSLLSELAGEQPVVCLVDDAQWADRPSLHVLEFVARRLATERVAVLIATRTEEYPPAVSGVFDVPLTGLDRESARDLLLERAGAELSAAQQETILDAAVGNPLALRELPGRGAPCEYHAGTTAARRGVAARVPASGATSQCACAATHAADRSRRPHALHHAAPRFRRARSRRGMDVGRARRTR